MVRVRLPVHLYDDIIVLSSLKFVAAIDSKPHIGAKLYRSCRSVGLQWCRGQGRPATCAEAGFPVLMAQGPRDSITIYSMSLTRNTWMALDGFPVAAAPQIVFIYKCLTNVLFYYLLYLTVLLQYVSNSTCKMAAMNHLK